MSRRPRGTGSIFQQEGSSIWWIQYFRGGRRQRETTGMFCLTY
jgi:hypothetical protein